MSGDDEAVRARAEAMSNAVAEFVRAVWGNGEPPAFMPGVCRRGLEAAESFLTAALRADNERLTKQVERVAADLADLSQGIRAGLYDDDFWRQAVLAQVGEISAALGTGDTDE